MITWDEYDWEQLKGYISYSGFLPSAYYIMGKELHRLELISSYTEIDTPITTVIFNLFGS